MISKIIDVLKHIFIIALSLLILVGIPAVKYFGLFREGVESDAVSSASLVVPDSPSGEYYVFINKDIHKDTLTDWENFFTGKEFAVIFEDITCIVAEGDTGGIQLAKRYYTQLPENQMKYREENPTLLISKIEEGYIDIAVMSYEMAKNLGYDESRLKHVEAIKIDGGDVNEEA